MQLPAGKTFALSVTVDLDAQCAWMVDGLHDPSFLARGEFGPMVGTPRLLELFERYGVRTTWGIPGHTLMTWPEVCRDVVDRGHEICAHGSYHENLRDMPEQVERKLMTRQLEQYDEVIGGRPRGYRAPSGVLTSSTYPLMEEFGFEWHSGTGGRDFEPYYPREVVQLSLEDGNVFGREYRVLEFSTSWFLEDWVAFEYVSRRSTGLSSPDVVYERWKDNLEYGRQRCAPGVMTLVLHPQSIGRAHHMLMLERFMDYCTSLDDVWIAPLSDIYDAWSG